MPAKFVIIFSIIPLFNFAMPLVKDEDRKALEDFLKAMDKVGKFLKLVYCGKLPNRIKINIKSFNDLLTLILNMLNSLPYLGHFIF